MKQILWKGDDGNKKKPKERWASMRSGHPEDGGVVVFRWGDHRGTNQKVVVNESIALLLAQNWIKGNFHEVVPAPEETKDEEN